uniref:Uncharacterized protein AlNc14C2G332 n=1 Tax=Albugo laibachii Nc14 TaxID=890382 RepID=F0VZJ4_9STRA|nr:conserved hypothetical protein [Albugo laibachii Nc14]|eukprot:CCA14224.1 conserved hypothetical protein [Albugo laibachii Nc14]
MAYEDALACLLANRAPHFSNDEIEIDPNDLIDDEDDTSYGPDTLHAPPPAVPLVNALFKPLLPEGSLLQSDVASVFRLIQEIRNKWRCSSFQLPWESVHPQDAKGLPMYNAGGRYSIRLYVLGRWRSIDVDDRLPVDEEGASIYLSTMHTSDLWLALLCKAIAKLHYWLRESSSIEDDFLHINHFIMCLTSWKTVPFSEPPESYFNSEKPTCQEASDDKVEQNIRPELALFSLEANSNDLRPREVALIQELIQDEVNLTGFYDQFGKFVPVNDIDISAYNRFLIYPPARVVAEMIHLWDEASIIEYTASVGSLQPPKAISARYLVLRKSRQPEDGVVDAVLTLSRIPPVEIHAADLSDAAWKVLGVAKDGSLLLMEEDLHNQRTSPSLVIVDTTHSVRLSLDPNRDHLFRITPLSNLLYGFAFQAEAFLDSQEPPDMKIVEVVDHWKEQGLKTIKTCGRTNVLPQGSWTILMKQVIKVEAVDEPLWLWTNLDLSDASIAPNVSLSVVQNSSHTVIARSPLLYDKIKLPEDKDVALAGLFTVIIECHAPDQLALPPVAWVLSMATNGELASSEVYDQLPRVIFGGPYRPNDSMILFRDKLSVSKSSSLTSLQVQLMAEDEKHPIVNDLAVKIDIFESSGRLVSSSSTIRPSELQLPWPPDQSESCTLTVVASIDKALCLVPKDFQSQLPFHSSFSITPQTGEDPESSSIYWHVTCFSTEDIRFEPDLSKERDFEAVVEGWKQSGKLRDTNGAISRLLFQGEPELAEIKAREENVSEELMLKIQNRFMFDKEGGDSYIQHMASSTQRIKPPDEIEQEERAILETINVDEIARAERLAARVETKQALTDQLNDIWFQVHAQRAQLIEMCEFRL